MTVAILRLGHKGEGIADGPIFVPGALPGEIVSGHLDGNRLSDLKIETSVADRVAPPCPHYRRCGGCNMQHASDAFVADWKVDRVVSSLAAHGVTAPIRQRHTSPPGSRRRAVFAARRTKSGAEVGFHAARDDQIIPVPDCRVVTPALLQARNAIEEIARVIGSRKGRLKVAVTDTETGVDMLVSGSKPVERSISEALVSLGERFDLARLSVDGDVVFSRRTPSVSFGPIAVPLPPGAFLQATRDGETQLQSSVADAVAGAKGPILDLFAGCGTLTLPLALNAPVHAVESDGSALGALEAGWRHGQDLRAVTTERRDLFRRPLLPDELSRFDAAVIDPPRAGAEAQVAEIAKSDIRRLAMVSCDPITFARDASTLTRAGYHISWIDVVDQFRWSAHVELVAALKKR